MNEFVITYSRKLWFPPSKKKWIWNRGLQLLRRLQCKLLGHNWSQWRIETEDWFEYVEKAEPYAWHTCKNRCGAIEQVVAKSG